VPVLAESKKRFEEITKDALAKLAAYQWPGNVRELANTIERAVVPRQWTIFDDSRFAETKRRHRGAKQFQQSFLSRSHRGDAPRFSLKALAQSNGNRVAAAKALGLHEKYLLKLIKELQIR